jgi:hypothetical protein
MQGTVYLRWACCPQNSGIRFPYFLVNCIRTIPIILKTEQPQVSMTRINQLVNLTHSDMFYKFENGLANFVPARKSRNRLDLSCLGHKHCSLSSHNLSEEDQKFYDIDTRWKAITGGTDCWKSDEAY